MSDLFSVGNQLINLKTAPQPRPGRRILTEALVNGLPGGTASEAHDQSTVSTYSAFTVSCISPLSLFSFFEYSSHSCLGNSSD